MNQKLLIVLGVSANDGVLAERLLDHCYKLHGRCAIGHLLIVANSDLHSEQRQKIRITAELAFESVTETVAPAVDTKVANSKIHQMNNLFRHAALTVQTNFRLPWFWLEADCVPVKYDWISQLAEVYDQQPKKYMGLVAGASGKQFMARCGVYFLGASYALDSLCQTDVPFANAIAEKVIPSATNTDLIQYLQIETPEDLEKISKSAVVVHGDKLGLFAENWKSPLARAWDSLALAQDFRAAPMQPKEIAKEIDGGLDKPMTPSQIIVDELGIANPNEDQKNLLKILDENQSGHTPRLTRRQKREVEQAAKLDCVATEGCKSSTEAKSA